MRRADSGPSRLRPGTPAGRWRAPRVLVRALEGVMEGGGVRPTKRGERCVARGNGTTSEELVWVWITEHLQTPPLSRFTYLKVGIN